MLRWCDNVADAEVFNTKRNQTERLNKFHQQAVLLKIFIKNLYEKCPILIIEDNLSDQFMIKLAFKEARITNEIVMAKDGAEALKILKKKSFAPFMIISDVNMPGMNGFDLKKHIDSDKELQAKAIPFIYMSSSMEQAEVDRAFKLHPQGYFPKGDFENQKKVVELINNYWKESAAPTK